MSPERELFINRLRVRNYSPKTVTNYEQALVKAAKFLKKSPLNMTGKEIEQFFLHEIKVEKLAPATVNLHISAFKTFFNLVDPESKVMEYISKVKHVRHLPIVLTSNEVSALILATRNLKHRAIIEILYSSGVRLQECIDLRVKDIDSEKMLVHIHRGKGGKERYTVLSKRALKTLRKYYKAYHPHSYLFEGRNNNKVSPRTIDNVIKKASKRAGITKPVSPHTFRHSFATHLLEQNVNLRVIQKLLGHSNIKTTTIYLHVSNMAITNITNPLDILNKEYEGRAA
jgi:site-specific recombinase XerD